MQYTLVFEKSFPIKLQSLSIIVDPVNGQNTLMDVQTLNKTDLYDPHQCILGEEEKHESHDEWTWFGLNASTWHGYRIQFDKNSPLVGNPTSGQVEQINMKTGARLTVPMICVEDLPEKAIQNKYQIVVDRLRSWSLLVYVNEKFQAEIAYFCSGYLLFELENNEILYSPRFKAKIYNSNLKTVVANFEPFARDMLQRWVCDVCLLVMISKDRIVCFQPDGIGLYQLNGTRLDFRLASEFTIDVVNRLGDNIAPVNMMPYMFVHYLPHFDAVLEASPDQSLRLWQFSNNQIQLCCSTTTTGNTNRFNSYHNGLTALLISKDPLWEQQCIVDLSAHLGWIRSLVDIVYNYVV